MRALPILIAVGLAFAACRREPPPPVPELIGSGSPLDPAPAHEDAALGVGGSGFSDASDSDAR